MSDRPKRRSGGRAGNTRGNRGAIEQMPWRIVENTDRPIEPLAEEGILAIHEGAMEILEDIGIEFLNEEALGLLIFERQKERMESKSLSYIQEITEKVIS